MKSFIEYLYCRNGVEFHKNIKGWCCGGLVAVNADECLLTRMQEMSLDYHFTVEQEVGSATHAFFGFNGKLTN